MNFTILTIVFLSQVVLLSVFLPRRQVATMTKMMRQYPRSEFPRLYPREEEDYEASNRRFLRINLMIAAGGLVLLGWMILGSHDPEWDQAILTGFFLLQSVPWIGLDFSALREYRLMRLLNKDSTRRAELRPRRLFDAVSPALVYTAVAVYLFFCLFIAWVSRYGFEWFGGYANIVMISLANLVGVIVGWRILRGKRLDPHETNADRLLRAGSILRILLLTSIAVTVYGMLTISLKALGMEQWQPVTLSIYFQVLVLFSMRSYRFKRNDYEVYRDDGIFSGKGL